MRFGWHGNLFCQLYNRNSEARPRYYLQRFTPRCNGSRRRCSALIRQSSSHIASSQR
jgi:hypothetical protein